MLRFRTPANSVGGARCVVTSVPNRRKPYSRFPRYQFLLTAVTRTYNLGARCETRGTSSSTRVVKLTWPLRLARPKTGRNTGSTARRVGTIRYEIYAVEHRARRRDGKKRLPWITYDEADGPILPQARWIAAIARRRA